LFYICKSAAIPPVPTHHTTNMYWEHTSNRSSTHS